MTKQKRIAILGSTGSIGTQALDVIDHHPNYFEVEVLTANNNVELLIAQAIKYQPNVVVVRNKEKYSFVKESLSKYPIKVYAGEEAIEQVASMSTIDMLLSATVGFVGTIPVLRALEANIPVALANKEVLVVAGELVMDLAQKNNTPIIPVDSEHSAIFQCLQGELLNPIEKIILTASGGPFRGKDINFLKNVTKKEALNHPNWEMGDKITIDSATLMNKGLEVIEARWLFDLNPDQISVIVHPQSIIHSVVQFTDGSMKAQMGLPEMKLPIQYAMGYPQRLENDFPRFDFLNYPNLTFEEVDLSVFRNLSLAYEAMRIGGNAPCVLNAANEIVVDAFLNDKCKFIDMPIIIEKTIEKSSFVKNPTIEDYINSDIEAREIANSYL